MVQLKSLTVALALPWALAHPGENKDILKREMAMRNAQHAKATRSLALCQDSAEAKALRSRAAARRSAKAHDLRVKRGLVSGPINHQKRDLTNLEIYANLSHNRTDTKYAIDTPESTIFGSNNTCALVPETTIGPYYVTGEYIRQNITEGQAGVPMHMDIQFVDMNTCGPVAAVAADVWHCNSTGVYSGVAADDEGGLNSTFLRGVQLSDGDGVAAFDTLFPGHYDDRITHLHLVAQQHATLLPNGTYTDGTTVHVGQIYFEDALVAAVEATWPYSTNAIPFTTWEVDGWMLEEATDDYDPYVEYVQLGADLQDGLLAWITVAVDLSSDHSSNRTAAASYYEGGGVAHNGSSKGLPPSNPNTS